MDAMVNRTVEIQAKELGRPVTSFGRKSRNTLYQVFIEGGDSHGRKSDIETIDSLYEF